MMQQVVINEEEEQQRWIKVKVNISSPGGSPQALMGEIHRGRKITNTKVTRWRWDHVRTICQSCLFLPHNN